MVRSPNQTGASYAQTSQTESVTRHSSCSSYSRTQCFPAMASVKLDGQTHMTLIRTLQACSTTRTQGSTRHTEEVCQSRQSNNMQSLHHLKAKLNYTSASSTEDVLVRFRSSSNCSFHHSTVSPVRVSSSSYLLTIA